MTTYSWDDMVAKNTKLFGGEAPNAGSLLETELIKLFKEDPANFELAVADVVEGWIA